MGALFALIGIIAVVAIVDVVLRIRADRPRQRRIPHSDSGDWPSDYAEGGTLIDTLIGIGRRTLKTAPTRFLAWIKRVSVRPAGDRWVPAFRAMFARNPRDFRFMARSAVRVFQRRNDGR